MVIVLERDFRFLPGALLFRQFWFTIIASHESPPARLRVSRWDAGGSEAYSPPAFCSATDRLPANTEQVSRGDSYPQFFSLGTVYHSSLNPEPSPLLRACSRPGWCRERTTTRLTGAAGRRWTAPDGVAARPARSSLPDCSPRSGGRYCWPVRFTAWFWATTGCSTGSASAEWVWCTAASTGSCGPPPRSRQRGGAELNARRDARPVLHRETRAASRAANANIMTAIDADEEPTSGRTSPPSVLRDGTDSGHRPGAHRGGRCRSRFACHLAFQLADALIEAHRLGLITAI